MSGGATSTTTPAHERPAPVGTGPGQCPMFMCPACAKPRPQKGSKVRRFRGLRCRVCGECGEKVRA